MRFLKEVVNGVVKDRAIHRILTAAIRNGDVDFDDIYSIIIHIKNELHRPILSDIDYIHGGDYLDNEDWRYAETIKNKLKQQNVDPYSVYLNVTYNLKGNNKYLRTVNMYKTEEELFELYKDNAEYLSHTILDLYDSIDEDSDEGIWIGNSILDIIDGYGDELVLSDDEYDLIENIIHKDAPLNILKQSASYDLMRAIKSDVIDFYDIYNAIIECASKYEKLNRFYLLHGRDDFRDLEASDRDRLDKLASVTGVMYYNLFGDGKFGNYRFMDQNGAHALFKHNAQEIAEGIVDTYIIDLLEDVGAEGIHAYFADSILNIIEKYFINNIEIDDDEYDLIEG